ncbi:hypothetical protein ACLOJK_024328, partial [Asimina triloba]
MRTDGGKRKRGSLRVRRWRSPGKDSRKHFMRNFFHQQLESQGTELKQNGMSVADYKISDALNRIIASDHKVTTSNYESNLMIGRFAPNLVTDEEARIRRFQNGLNESIRDMVMAEPWETYGKAVDRAMWPEKAVVQFSRIFTKRKGEAVEEESL